MRRFVAVIALCTVVPLLAQSGGRDLWLGVLTYDSAPDGSVVSGAAAVLVPVATLAGGTWHGEPEADADTQRRLHDTYGRVPPLWMPIGRELPRAWRGWLTGGRVAPFEIRGPLRARELFAAHGVDTSLRPPRPGPDDHGRDVVGVAVSGELGVRLFVEEQKGLDPPPPEPLRRAMIDVELRELAATAAAAMAEAWYRKALEKISPEFIAERPYDYTRLRTASQSDGTRVVVFEGNKSLGTSEGCTNMHSGAAMAQSPAGEATVLGAWTYVVCNELHVDHRPLAIIERGGRSCWVSEYQYEDGVRYVLLPPGVVDDVRTPTACAIR